MGKVISRPVCQEPYAIEHHDGKGAGLHQGEERQRRRHAGCRESLTRPAPAAVLDWCSR